METPAADLVADPGANLKAIQATLRSTLTEASRPLDSVTITAVSKTFDASAILPALRAGHRVFGENRVQEASQKWPPLREQFRDVELRLIGPLQSKKAKEAVALFDVIETVDREKIAKALSEEMARQNRPVKTFIQVNTGEEAQKSGVVPADADGFIQTCREEYQLNVVGLMCIPPIDAVVAPHFALLAKIAERNNLRQLSMGMSRDYQTAAQLGATHLRIGTGVFGPRAEKI